MTEENGNSLMIEYLDTLSEYGDLFKSLQFASELMSQLPLSEEQIEYGNIYLQQLLEEWSKNFKEMLEIGVEWIEKNSELDDN